MLEGLGNVKAEIDSLKASLDQDATELGLSIDRLVSVVIDDAQPTQIRGESAKAISDARARLGTGDSTGLSQALAAVDARIADIQSQMDAPNRAYQAYLRSLEEWETRRSVIEGSDEEPDSLRGLTARLAALNDLPGAIEAARAQQAELALQIHRTKTEQAQVYRELYGPVQDFANSYPLAKEKLGLEFRTALTSEDFAEDLLSMVAQNRRGSFYGLNEGRKKVDALVRATDWDDSDSVKSFLSSVDEALHVDQREEQGVAMQVWTQLAKGTEPEDVFDLLYGLQYVEPRYVLRWQGKELSMLSPGERGTLLLVFYLLLDRSDVPLAIDQPECNLDNLTVYHVLVDCIKAARKRRQVFIVTHNPNLAVVCDADQIIHAEMDKEQGNKITYTTGALENPTMSRFAVDVLEGTRPAFDVRDGKYRVCNGTEPGAAA